RAVTVRHAPFTAMLSPSAASPRLILPTDIVNVDSLSFLSTDFMTPVSSTMPVNILLPPSAYEGVYQYEYNTYGYGGVSDVEGGPVEGRVAEPVKIEEVGDVTEPESVYAVSNSAAEYKRERED